MYGDWDGVTDNLIHLNDPCIVLMSAFGLAFTTFFKFHLNTMDDKVVPNIAVSGI